jgi:tRNA G37 N-methylase Trm5
MKAKHSLWKNKLAKTMFFTTVILVAALFFGTAASAGLTPTKTSLTTNAQNSSAESLSAMNNGSTYSYMMVGNQEKSEQWCLRVPVRKGEEMRRALSDEGILDRALKPRIDASDLLIPIICWRDGAQRCSFDSNPERPVLPRHEMIGGIAVMQDRDIAGALAILAARPSLQTVLYPIGAVNGEYRTRRLS